MMMPFASRLSALTLGFGTGTKNIENLGGGGRAPGQVLVGVTKMSAQEAVASITGGLEGHGFEYSGAYHLASPESTVRAARRR